MDAVDPATIFANTKLLFDKEFPTATVVFAGMETEVGFNTLEYTNEFSFINIDIKLGQTEQFTHYSTNSTTGWFTINPTDDDIGFYEIEAKVTSGSQEYEKKLKLNVMQDPTALLESNAPIVDSEIEPEIEEIIVIPVEIDQDAANETVKLEVGDLSLELDPNEITKDEVKSILGSEAMKNLTVAQQQEVLESLLKYNMQYLQEQAAARKASSSTDMPAPDPDLEIQRITPNGEFLMVFNIDLAGPSFIKELG